MDAWLRRAGLLPNILNVSGILFLLLFFAAWRARFEVLSVLERLILSPGTVAIAESDPLSEGRVGAAEELEDLAGIGVGQILLLQGDERFAGCLVDMSDLETEAIGLMLHTSGDRIAQGGGDEHQNGRD